METLKDPSDYVGERVIVTPNDCDAFLNEFEGTVIGVINGFLQVRDQDDDVFDVEVSQVSVIE